MTKPVHVVVDGGLDDVKMIPLDLTERFAWSADEVQAMRGAGRAGTLLADAIRDVQERNGIFVPHDAVAAIAMTSPELFGWNTRLVHCETKGEFTTGETVVDRRPWATWDLCSWARTLTSRKVSARILSAVASIA